jgi:hypothetical protein
MKIKPVSIPAQDPIAGHDIHTTRLGFISKQFEPEAQLAIFTSPESNGGPALLLEPCIASFYEDFQNTSFKFNLPVMIFASSDVDRKLKRIETADVTIRTDLDKPDWGPVNMFENAGGNLQMIKPDI